MNDEEWWAAARKASQFWRQFEEKRQLGKTRLQQSELREEVAPVAQNEGSAFRYAHHFSEAVLAGNGSPRRPVAAKNISP